MGLEENLCERFYYFDENVNFYVTLTEDLLYTNWRALNRTHLKKSEMGFLLVPRVTKA